MHSKAAKWMHWLFAGGVIAAVGLALAFDDMPFSPLKLTLMNYHKWIGVLVLALVVPRFFIAKAGFISASKQSWEDYLAAIVHKLMYVFMVLVPLAGIAMSQAKGFPVVLFGVVPLPSIPFVSSNMAEMLEGIHKTSAWLWVALIVLHVVGAIKRQLSGDKVISRMAP
jgi:cytochrome b561